MSIISVVLLLALAAVEPISGATTGRPGYGNMGTCKAEPSGIRINPCLIIENHCNLGYQPSAPNNHICNCTCVHGYEKPVEICCDTKTVGDYRYTKVHWGSGNLPSNCKNDCVYTRDDKPGSKYCFAEGEQEVHCHDEAAPPHHSLGDFMTEDCHNADESVDDVLAIVDKAIIREGYDPKDLPSGEATWKKSVWPFGHLHGSAKYSDGRLIGLSTLHRTGKAQICVNDKSIRLSANIGVTNARAEYGKLSAEFEGVGVEGSAEATIRTIDIYFEASVAASGHGGVQLTRFEITRIGHIDFNIEGLGLLDEWADDIIGFISNTIKGFITPLIGGPIKDELQKIINEEIQKIIHGLMPSTTTF